jgi:hypothetical protein
VIYGILREWPSCGIHWCTVALASSSAILTWSQIYSDSSNNFFIIIVNNLCEKKKSALLPEHTLKLSLTVCGDENRPIPLETAV